ncbi:MAG: hypothetical protein LBT91_02630 [Bifidobacteriaceae bacterium]|jgi:hypothetical protein|nr:hypothetical protein [Bifidobacteriaceae bacterium]
MIITVENIEKFINKYELDWGNAEVSDNMDGTLEITVEAPNNWTCFIYDKSFKIGDEMDDEKFFQIVKSNLAELDYDDYFDEMWESVKNQFRPSEFLQMLEDDKRFFDELEYIK